MKKYIIATAVVLLLIVFPLVSWLYLDSGLKYRKEIRLELANKGKVALPLSNELGLLEKTTVIHSYSPGNKNIIQKIKRFKNQFDDVEDFQIISLLNTATLYNPEDSIDWKMVSYPDSASYTDLFFSNNFTLIDTGANIRNYYNAQDTSIRNLIEHIAFILPVKKDLDIELRRKKEK
jgi:hypothetical protein